MTTTAPNPYLAGNFAPVRDERDDSDLEVTGAIPSQLDGLLLRNGPNPALDPNPAEYHWFIGDSMLHGIELRDGKARYRNRFVRTAAYCEENGEKPPPGSVNDHMLPTRASTAVAYHAGRIMALYEPSLPTEVRADLSTVGLVDFGGALSTPFTAHPKIDPITEEMHFFGYDIFGPPYLRYHVVNPSGTLITTEPITLPGPVMMHDFAITTNHVVFLDLPVIFDAALLGHQPFPFEWRPSHGARVGLMPRGGGDADVVWCDIDPCYVYHVLNAYDEPEGSVIIDLVRYPDMFATEKYGPGSTAKAVLERWTVDPKTKRVGQEVLDDVGQEFPRIDERQIGRVHRYGYSAEVNVRESWAEFGGVRKHDLVSGGVERHDLGAGRGGGEPVFVPAAPDSGEDEGWLLTVVYDKARDTSDVVIIDASEVSGAAVATVHLRRRVPFGFHGAWIPGVKLG
jgi:carotenoid cleavage dioxygenase